MPVSQQPDGVALWWMFHLCHRHPEQLTALINEGLTLRCRVQLTNISCVRRESYTNSQIPQHRSCLSLHLEKKKNITWVSFIHLFIYLFYKVFNGKWLVVVWRQVSWAHTAQDVQPMFTHHIKIFTCNLWCHCEPHSKVSHPGIQVIVNEKKKSHVWPVTCRMDRFRNFTVELLCNYI